MDGVIERLVVGEGFGFIRGSDGQEYFFHLTGLKSTEFSELAEGSMVEFSLGQEDPGDRPGEHPRAVNVRLAADEMPAVENEPLPREKTGQR